MSNEKFGEVQLDSDTQAQVCPACGQLEVFVRPDGQLRHCFACGLNIPAQTPAPLDAVMNDIFKAAHRQLLDGGEALTYLLNERGLHLQVLIDSMIGVIPTDLDVTQLMMPRLEAAQAELDRILALPKKPGRPSKQDQAIVDGATGAVMTLKNGREQLLTLEDHAGRLAFFYTNSAHRITRVRVEPVNDGESTWLNLGGASGVFNHGMFEPQEPARSLEALQRQSIVVMSEFDQLQLQSLGARLAAAEGLRPCAGYVSAVAVGFGAVDASMVRALGRLPLIIKDLADKARSRAVVDSIRQELNVFETRVPGGTTLDAFLRNGSDLDARHALLQLSAARTLALRPYDRVANEVDMWRAMEGVQGKKFEADRWASGVLVRDVSERGQLFYDGRVAYVFDKQSKQLLPVDRDHAQMQLFLHQYGVAPTDAFLKPALSALQVEAQRNGTQTTVHSLSHYDAAANRLYVFDHDRHIYRVTRSHIEQVDNGTDGVLFVSNPNYERFEVGTPKGKPNLLTDTLLGSVPLREQALSRAEQEQLFAYWLYAMFFPELFPTRPILAIIGEKGSGKTSVLRRIGQLLFGRKFQVMGMSHEPRDFDAAVTGEGFVAVDNADADVSWLNDKLAVVATGGTLKRREYYTTNGLVEFPIKAFVGITSRTPHFKREDVADRLLLFHVERLKEFTAEGTLLTKLTEQRNEVMTELVGELQRILAAFGASAGKSYASSFRIADFGEFVLRAEAAAGRITETQTMFDRLGDEQLAFSVQDDPFIEILESWVCVKGNAGKELTTAQLYQTLKEHAIYSQPRQVFDFRNPIAFGGYLQSKKATLKVLFAAEERQVSGRRRVWRFSPPEGWVNNPGGAALVAESEVPDLETLLQEISNLRVQ